MNDDWMLMLPEAQQNQFQLMKQTNEYTQRFGLCLSDQDIRELMDRRRECLSEQQRIEFGTDILDKLIFAFCDSDYIYQENYADTIAKLQDIFYLYKNESLDELSDDELIDIMKNAFNGVCQGSLEYLEETYLDCFAREIRPGSHKFIGRYPITNEKV